MNLKQQIISYMEQKDEVDLSELYEPFFFCIL